MYIWFVCTLSFVFIFTICFCHCYDDTVGSYKVRIDERCFLPKTCEMNLLVRKLLSPCIWLLVYTSCFTKILIIRIVSSEHVSVLYDNMTQEVVFIDFFVIYLERYIHAFPFFEVIFPGPRCIINTVSPKNQTVSVKFIFFVSFLNGVYLRNAICNKKRFVHVAQTPVSDRISPTKYYHM